MALALATEMAWNPNEIAIGISHGALGTHLGIAFHNGQATRLVHLAWHLTLIDEEFPKANWLACVIEFPPVVASQVIVIVRNLCKRYPAGHARTDGITYGLNLVAGRGAIKATGAYKPGKGCDGYTCSSFVAEIFSHFGLELVRRESMLDLPRNHAWAEAILCMLVSTGATAEHVGKVRANFKGTRLRPEEVCAAAEMPATQWPVDMAQIQARADQVSQEVQAKCGPPPQTPDNFAPCRQAYLSALLQLDQVEVATAEMKCASSSIQADGPPGDFAV